MTVLAIAVSTMVAVALVVFAIEMHLYKKHEGRRDKLSAPPNRAAGKARQAPMAS